MQIKKFGFYFVFACLFGVFSFTASEVTYGQNGMSASLVNGLTPSTDVVVLDDFSGDLSNFTSNVILDVNDGASNSTSFAINGGALEVNTTTYDDIEQHAFIYDGASLNVGDELQADFSDFSGNRNFGLYVGGTAPTTDVRRDYIAVYGGGDRISSRGFDGTVEYNLVSSASGVAATVDSLFIARTGVNTFEVGFIAGGNRTVMTTRTTTTANSADFIGFYADVRDTGTISTADNLRIVTPDPDSNVASIVARDALLAPSGSRFGRSLNAVGHQSTPLLSFGDFQFATWYRNSDNEEHVMLGRRSLASPDNGWEIIDTGLDLLHGDQTTSWDSHNAINIGISGDGRIHLAYDHHVHPLNYLPSVVGAATGNWTTSDVYGIVDPRSILQDSFRPSDPALLGVTYPRFATDPATGNMVATYRLGGSGNGDLSIVTYDSLTGQWSGGREFITGRDGALYNDSVITGITTNSFSRNAYLNDINFGIGGTLHATFTWRETAGGGNHDLNYITSNDNGLTWLNDSGDLVADIGASVSITSPGITIDSDTNFLPPGLFNAPASANPPLGQIDRLQALINQQGQTVDLQGGVHALMWQREDPSTYSPGDGPFDSSEAAYFHYYKDPSSGQWSRSQIPLMDEDGNILNVGSRPKIVYDEDGNVFAAYVSRAGGGLVVAGATVSSNYSDWSILYRDATRYEGEPAVDQQRFLRDSVLSVLIQDTNFSDTGVTTSNLRVFDFAVTSPESTLLGDCNLDGVVDFSDIVPFISILSASGYLEEADVNQDGAVDFSDVRPFISVLSN